MTIYVEDSGVCGFKGDFIRGLGLARAPTRLLSMKT